MADTLEPRDKDESGQVSTKEIALEEYAMQSEKDKDEDVGYGDTVSHLQVQTQASSNHRSRGRTRRFHFRRLNIQDSGSGVTVFEKIWKCRGSTSSSEGIDAMLRSFSQFARENDAGLVSKCRFELPHAKRHKRKVSRMPTTGAVLGLSGGYKYRPVQPILRPQEMMEMVCVRNETFSVVLFHDITQGHVPMSQLTPLVRGVLNQFTEIFKHSLLQESTQGALRNVRDINEQVGKQEVSDRLKILHGMFNSFDVENVLLAVQDKIDTENTQE